MNNTFINWLTVHVPGVTLSEESKAKVSIIHDINKMLLMVNGDQLSVTEFDYLYDMSLVSLRQYEMEAQMNAESIMRWRQYELQKKATSGGDQDAD